MTTTETTRVKICPQCKTEHPERIKRCGCGYTWPDRQEAQRAGPIADPMHGCCQIEVDGLRCHNPGVWTASTTGSGPWCCTAHSIAQGGEEAYRIILDSHHAHPVPDYSIKARREQSRAGGEQQVPAWVKGWALDEYRLHARQSILKLAGKTKTNQPERAEA